MMFVSLKFKGMATASLLSLTIPMAAQAATLATASADADSYLAFNTNNQTSVSTTIGRDIRPAGYEFNFATIEFDNTDLAGLTTAGDKFLVIELLEFVTLGPAIGGPPSQISSSTGNATIKVVGLDESYADYLGSPSNTAWYDTYLGDAAADATASATQAGLVYFDVTDVVNGWIDDPSSNNGFGLVVTAGDDLIEIGATDDFFPTGTFSPILSSVPEPTSMALLALGGLATLRRRP